MTHELKLIQSTYNFIIDLIACIMKIGVLCSLPFAFIYYMRRAMKSKKNNQNLMKIKRLTNSLLFLICSTTNGAD